MNAEKQSTAKPGVYRLTNSAIVRGVVVECPLNKIIWLRKSPEHAVDLPSPAVAAALAERHLMFVEPLPTAPPRETKAKAPRFKEDDVDLEEIAQRPATGAKPPCLNCG